MITLWESNMVGKSSFHLMIPIIKLQLAGGSGGPPASHVCLKMVYPKKNNGFADHYPYEKWL